MLMGRVCDAEEGMRIGLSQYSAEDGKGLQKAFELAEKIAGNAPLFHCAVLHALPRIVEMGQAEGLFTESLMASMASTNPQAIDAVR